MKVVKTLTFILYFVIGVLIGINAQTSENG